jgi:hypothetical protein
MVKIMTMKKVFATGLSAAVLSVGGLALSAGNAQAATISYSGNLFSNVEEATTGSASLLKFNSALGTLTGVTLTSQVSGSAVLQVTNNDNDQKTRSFTNGTAKFDFTLTAPEVSVTSTASTGSISGSVPAPKGTTKDFLGAVSIVDGSYDVLPKDLFDYIGNGTKTFTATGDLSDGTYTGTGSRLSFGGYSLLSAKAIVTYTYTEAPPAAVPEPLTILGAATAVGFGAAFKRRALKNNKKG